MHSLLLACLLLAVHLCGAQSTGLRGPDRKLSKTNGADIGCVFVNGIDAGVPCAPPAPPVVPVDNEDEEDEDDSEDVQVISNAQSLPPPPPAQSGIPGAAPTRGKIVAVAQATPQLSSLVALVTRAGLVPTLNGDGPFTVFAPVNGPGALPTGPSLLEMLQLETDTIADILKYHVVSGEIRSTDLMDGMEVSTVQGSKITVSIDPMGAPMINGANVVTADVVAFNGIIHLIDGVLTPPVVSTPTPP
ncbi:beta-induced protein ig-h3 [Seminavis robusta]|uniref:Beta-induced protein ig-h3 n=1 Tax=Seminavis robusta TaxID=568900 RepID=A0A9N8H4I9_9STRA|nr:beta-induced protein ig-h3 [Seminavis robusta]|eukprot:Sro64_g036380.1 beta-induced protein ig-h3 (246) ;mRNA; f:98692-99513